MKSLVIYDTKTRNTPKVANAIAKTLKCKAKRVSEIGRIDLANYDLVGFGSGTYYGKHSKQLLEFVESAELGGKEVFIFSTSGVGGKIQHRALRGVLKRKSAWIIGEFGCKGVDMHPFWKRFHVAEGHPDRIDLSNAVKFAKELLKETRIK